MRLSEQKIVESLEKGSSYLSFEYWDELHQLPLGQWSEEFCENENVAKRAKKYGVEYSDDLNLIFRWIIEKHLMSHTPLAELDKLLEPYRNHIKCQKVKGQYLRQVSDELIYSIYQSGNENLIEWIKSYFPAPPQYCTTENPQEILSCSTEQMKNERLQTIISNISNDLPRVAEVHLTEEEYLQWENSTNKTASSHSFQWAQELIDDANTPYKPKKCDDATAQRIVEMVKKITVLETAKYGVKQENLIQSLDDGLYSQSAAADLYISRPERSQANPNAVILNLQKMTSRKWNENITIEFDLKKLISLQPLACFTQMDFHEHEEKNRYLHFGAQTLSIDHTCYTSFAHELFAILHLQADEHSLYAGVLKPSLASDNLADMHAILTLNFFRFIDNLRNHKGMSDTACIESFYTQLASLSDEALQTFLIDIQTYFTDTAQLHLYRMHQIDFNTVRSINRRYGDYTVSIPQLIEELNTGSVDTLRVVNILMPELLKSKRFTDYLLSCVTHSDVKPYLIDISQLAANEDTYTRIQNHFRQYTLAAIDQIEKKKFPEQEYLGLLELNAIEDSDVDLDPLEHILVPVYKEAGDLSRKKLLERIQQLIRQCINKMTEHYSYEDNKQSCIRSCFPTEYCIWNGKDTNKDARTAFTQLFNLCETPFKQEIEAKASGINDVIKLRENFRKRQAEDMEEWIKKRKEREERAKEREETKRMQAEDNKAEEKGKVLASNSLVDNALAPPVVERPSAGLASMCEKQNKRKAVDLDENHASIFLSPIANSDITPPVVETPSAGLASMHEEEQNKRKAAGSDKNHASNLLPSTANSDITPLVVETPSAGLVSRSMKKEQRKTTILNTNSNRQIQTQPPAIPAVVRNAPLAATSKRENLLSTSEFDSTLKQMKKASQDVQDSHATAGGKLHHVLDDARTKFLQTGNSNQFIHSVREEVKKSEPVLNKSAKWKQFLLDILNAIIRIFTRISDAVTSQLGWFSKKSQQTPELDKAKEVQQHLSASIVL